MAICRETLAHDILSSTLKARALAQRQGDMHFEQAQLRARQEETAQRVNAPAPRAALSSHYKEVAGLTDGFDVAKTDKAARSRLIGALPELSLQATQSAARRLQSEA
jgi:hypothetical protein